MLVTAVLSGLVGCDAEPDLPAPAASVRPVDMAGWGLEPSRADLVDTRVPAAPAGERQAMTAPTVVRMALGRTAMGLGGDALLATLPPNVALQRSIVGDRDAIELLLLGKTEFAITAAPLTPRERQAGLWDTTLGIELFALVVADATPLHDIRGDVARALLNGQLTDGVQAGLPAGPIVLGVPADSGVRERAARALIHGDAFARTARLIDGDRGAFDLLLREPGAVAVVHVASIAHASSVHMLEIDSARPTAESFALGTYKAGTPLLLVTSGKPNGAAAALAATVADGSFALAPDAMLAPGR